MKIKRISDLLNESLGDTPITYIERCLFELKNKIDNYFDQKSESETIKSLTDFKSSDKKNNYTFKELDITYDGSQISKSSKINDYLKIEFNDGEFEYSLIIIIPLEENINLTSTDDIKVFTMKIKKYESDTTKFIGEIDRTIQGEQPLLSVIDENYIIEFIIELNDKFTTGDNFEIETK